MKKIKNLRDFARDLSRLVETDGHVVDLDVSVKNLASVISGEYRLERNYSGKVAFSEGVNYGNESERDNALNKAIYDLAYFLIHAEKNPCIIVARDRVAEKQTSVKVHVKKFRTGQDSYDDSGVIQYQSERVGS